MKNLQLTEKFDEALVFARRSHDGDNRKGDVAPPALAHLMIVSSLILEMGGSEDEAIAGLLHDTVEDTETTLEDLELAFGADVARLVAAASEPKLDQNGEKLPWRFRKEYYVGSIAGKTADELRVTLADKIANITVVLTSELEASAHGPEAVERYWAIFNAGRPEQEWYFESLAAEFEAARATFEPEALPMLNVFQTLVRKFVEDGK